MDPRITAIERQGDPLSAAFATRFGGADYVILRATLEDGSECSLFSYYSDELSFADQELIGLTVAQARRLRHDKDVAYLQS